MMFSPDTVSRQGRAANGVFGMWVATVRAAVGILRSFLPDVWPVLVVLFTWLFMAALYPFFAASNAMLVFTVGSLAYLVGSRVGQLGVWPGSILVPRYTGLLFVLCVSGVVLPTLLAGLGCWSLGNSVPSVAPALLVGAAMMRHAIRRPVPPSGVGAWWLILAFATLCGAAFAGERQPLVQLAGVTSLLSLAWIQIPALLGAGLIVPVVYRALARETTVVDRAAWSPIGIGDAALEDLREGAGGAAGALGMVVLMWYFFPRTAEDVFLIVWLVSLGNTIFHWWESTVHVQLSRNWIFGIARDRRDLGRRAAARVVWMSLPWLVLGSCWSGIHALMAASREAFLLKEVLLIQIAVLIVATSLCYLTRRLPPSFFGRTGIYSVFLGLGGGSCAYFAHDHDLNAVSYATLILALTGAGLSTVFFGGWALARAEILSEVYSRPDWRSRGTARNSFAPH